MECPEPRTGLQIADFHDCHLGQFFVLFFALMYFHLFFFLSSHICRHDQHVEVEIV